MEKFKNIPEDLTFGDISELRTKNDQLRHWQNVLSESQEDMLESMGELYAIAGNVLTELIGGNKFLEERIHTTVQFIENGKYEPYEIGFLVLYHLVSVQLPRDFEQWFVGVKQGEKARFDAFCDFKSSFQKEEKVQAALTKILKDISSLTIEEAIHYLI